MPRCHSCCKLQNNNHMHCGKCRGERGYSVHIDQLPGVQTGEERFGEPVVPGTPHVRYTPFA